MIQTTFATLSDPRVIYLNYFSSLSLPPQYTHVYVQVLPSSLICAFILTQHSWFTHNITLLFFPSFPLCWLLYPFLMFHIFLLASGKAVPLAFSLSLCPGLSEWVSDRVSEWVGGDEREKRCVSCASPSPLLHPSIPQTVCTPSSISTTGAIYQATTQPR